MRRIRQQRPLEHSAVATDIQPESVLSRTRWHRHFLERSYVEQSDCDEVCLSVQCLCIRGKLVRRVGTYPPLTQ